MSPTELADLLESCLTPYGVRGFDIIIIFGSFEVMLKCLTPYGVRGFDMRWSGNFTGTALSA
mgnify:CR=1 FL=1